MVGNSIIGDALENLKTELDDVLGIKSEPSQRKRQFENFLQGMERAGADTLNAEAVARRLGFGEAQDKNGIMRVGTDLYLALSQMEMEKFQQHLDCRMQELRREFPELEKRYFRQLKALS
jgi:hypothetical protein